MNDIDLFQLWAMYRRLPGWLWICQAIGVDEDGLKALEAIDEAWIEFESESRLDREEISSKIREMIDEAPEDWARARRTESLKNRMVKVNLEIETIDEQYSDAVLNDEPYESRAVLSYPLDKWEKVKTRTERELKALEHGGQVNHFVDRVPQAKERQFSEFLELKNGKALCPFHEDRNPSFSVKDEHGHCFACGWHGSIIDFIMGLKGLSFQEALEFLT